jgi:hypothetical protein
MKAVAYVALHYGSAYLAYAVRSVLPAVDEVWFLYTSMGSHGWMVNYQPPFGEDRATLRKIAEDAAGDKFRWHEPDIRKGEKYRYEGQHRDKIYELTDADIILVLDSDEIWCAGSAMQAVEEAYNGNVWGHRVPIIHYWRSFRRAILHDPAYPIRVINTRYEKLSGEATLPHLQPINHFGYAIKPQLMVYKWAIHGHRHQLRKDVNWFSDVYNANRQVDCHPVGSQYWNTERVDPLRYMPDFMEKHPYFNMEVIE